MKRFDVINYFIKKNNYLNYLEIGVRDPNSCFNKVKAAHKDGVDPDPFGWGIAPPDPLYYKIKNENLQHLVDKSTGNKIYRKPEINYPVTSDDFFELLKDNPEIKYDIIFIDGLHLHEQALKDIKNSLKHLKDNGTIVMHDCCPTTYEAQVEEYVIGKTWNGTVWKAFVECRCTMPNINMNVINTDWGLGIIQFGKQNLWTKDSLEKCHEYSYLEKNRKELLNLISVEEFKTKYKTGYYEK